jgi:HisJ family histidinol phosphate phosphatase
MHSHYSDGDSSIEDYVDEAAEFGLEEIAITDHVWRSSDWVEEYVADIRRIDEARKIAVHAGLEAKVINRAGDVDVAEEDVELVDFVMGVVHRYRPEADAPHDDSCNYSVAEAAQAERDLTIAMLDNDVIDVVGHPTRNYYKFHYGPSQPAYPDEYIEEMVNSAVATGTPLEYNARLPASVRERLLEHYLAAELPFTIGSDSHQVGQITNLNHEEVDVKMSSSKP